MSQSGAIETVWRIEADVAVAAVVSGCFAEVTQQYAAAAYSGLCEFEHLLQFFVAYTAAARLLGEVTQSNHIGHGVEHQSMGRQAVASGTTYFLVVAFDVGWQIVVYHIAYVALVDAHAECYCGAHHLHGAVYEGLLRSGAFGGIHAGVVAYGAETECVDAFGHFLGAFAAEAVNYAGVVRMLAYKRGDHTHFVFQSGVVYHLQRNVGAVERANPCKGCGQIQIRGYVAAAQAVGGGGESHYRHVRIFLFYSCQVCVYGPEIVAPLRYAVCLVDGEQVYRYGIRPAVNFQEQPFRRYVQQFNVALEQGLHHRAVV